METIMHIGDSQLRVHVEGNHISDYQVLRALRRANITDDDARWSIGVSSEAVEGLDTTEHNNPIAILCYQQRTPSGKLSARIRGERRILIDGYAYRGHSFGLMLPNGTFDAQLTYGFERVSR